MGIDQAPLFGVRRKLNSESPQIKTKTKQTNKNLQTKWKDNQGRPDTWCSAKVLACHAAGSGSIPGRGNKDA